MFPGLKSPKKLVNWTTACYPDWGRAEGGYLLREGVDSEMGRVLVLDTQQIDLKKGGACAGLRFLLLPGLCTGGPNAASSPLLLLEQGLPGDLPEYCAQFPGRSVQVETPACKVA